MRTLPSFFFGPQRAKCFSSLYLRWLNRCIDEATLELLALLPQPRDGITVL